MRLPEIPGYQYEDLLEEDPFGWTFVCLHASGERRAIKVLKSQATDESFLERYLKTFGERESSLSGTVPLLDYRIEGEDSLTAYVTPLYGWKAGKEKKWQTTSLKRLLNYFSGDQAFEMVVGLARSIAATHDAGIFHGGLKPGSVYLSGDSEGFQEVLVGDFGQVFMGGLQYLEAGDLLFYTSPEQLGTGDFSNGLGFRWDVYAFGVIAFQLLTGHLPRLDRLRQQCLKHPDAMNSAAAISYGGLTPVSEHFAAQLEKERPVEWPEDAEDERIGAFRSMVEACLEFDAEKRPESMVPVYEAISEIWQSLTQPAAGHVEDEAPERIEQPLEETTPAIETPIEEVAIAKEPVESVPIPVEQSDAAPDSSPTSTEVASVDESGVEPSLVGDELLELEEEAKGAPVSSKIVRGVFAERPALKWKLMAIVAMVAVVPLGYLVLKNQHELKTARAEATVKTNELQASVNQQAEAYLQNITEIQKSSQQLQGELSEAEDNTSRLVGEAKLARQILRQTQAKGDEFFRLLLDNRDTDVPGFRKKRADTLLEARNHYERLIEVYGDAPDFIVSTANAFFYLGRIYEEMGEFGKSLAAFGEAERRYVALLEDSRTRNVEYVKNLAIAKQSLGKLSIKNGKYAEARHFFTESSRFWTEARSLEPANAVEAGVNIHENSLSVVDCEISIGRIDAALDATRSVGSQLIKFQEEDPEDERIISALGRSFALAGRILETQGELEKAEAAYQQSADLYAKAVKLNAAVDDYQLGLGNSLARVGLLSKDMEKLKGAVDVLGRVVVHNPYESIYQKTFADVYGVLARDQRDGGRLESAISLEREAISVLQPIVRENGLSTPPDVLYSFSLRLAHLAELLGDEGQFDESRKPLNEAIDVLEKISEKEPTVANYRRALARARGLAGFACLKSGDKSEAKEHLELAKAEWESYAKANPDDVDAEQAVRWTTDQLRGL